MYKERLVISEKKWPPVRGHQLINLQLVEIEKHEGFQGQEKDKKSKKKIKSIRISPNDIFSAKKGKLPIRKVLVEGSAGVGKTTLCTILTEGWAKGNLLAQFDLVLFLPLRDRRVSSAESLSDLLKIVCVSEAQCSIAVDFIKKNFGKDVLIIADGWDELENRKRSEYSFLYQLFTGQYLRLVSVLLTSRPSVSADLHDVSTLHRVVEVVGFDEECVKEYIKSEFEEHPEKASTLIDQLEDNPIVQSVCSVPLNCAILCNLWHSLNQELPKTLTELYTQLVLNIIFRNIKKATTNTEQNIGLSLNSFESIPSPLDLEFWRTCEFAYDCLLHDKIVFSDADLISLFPEGMRLSNDFLCFGLLQLAKSPYLIGHALSFHFLHLTIQEFLAALHFSTVSSAEKLELCKDQARNSHLNMFWRFVFGLGCRKCQSKANTSASRRFCSCDDALVDLFISEAKTTLSEKIQFSICFGDQRLLLCHCAFESKDRTISTKIAQEMSCMFKITTYTPFDSLAVCHVLSYSSESKVDIGMSNCGLGDKHLEELTSVLSSKDDKMKVKDLHLENNNLTEVSIYNLFKYGVKSLESLENLYLQNNKLQNIVGVFNHSFLIWLKKLSLSDNPLGEMGISSLASALDGSFGVLASLSELELCNTFTDDAKINAKVLAKLLASLSSGYHIFSLDLSCNNFGVPGACELGKALPKLSKFLGITLILKETNLTCEAMICFSTNALEQFSLTSSVTSSTLFLVATSTLHISVPNVSLILSHNPLGYGGLVAAFRLLKQEKCYIQSLKLRKTGITCPSSTYDGPRLKHLVCDNGSAPLHSLSLRGNDLSGEGISILVDCLQICKQLEFLSTEKCSITSTDTLKFCSLLRELKMSCTNLKTWNLCKNSISDDGIYSLIENLPELFPNLSQVYVVDNHMLSTEMKSFLNRTLLGVSLHKTGLAITLNLLFYLP